MTLDQNLPDLQQRATMLLRGLTPAVPLPSLKVSFKGANRRTYRRAVSDSFQFIGGKHPVEIVPNDVLRWRAHSSGRP